MRAKKRSADKYTFTMPEGGVDIRIVVETAEVIAAAVDEPAVTQPTVEPEDAADSRPPFSDVSERDDCYDAVAFVYRNGLMIGVGDGTYFAPDTALSRAMVARMLYTLEEHPMAVASGFTDVARDFWYTGAIDWATAAGVISGYGNSAFGPNDDVTREQLLLFCDRGRANA